MAVLDLLHGDCRAVMAGLPAASVDAVVCDPPYGLSFMGKDWDHGVPGVAFWSAAMRVAKPGAHLLAFGGTRTFHRLAVAIEDAGWEIRDTVMWVYGSGFPKSHNAGNGWGTALKPAWEPIIVARKPLEGTVAANVLAHGTGALNIDGCRVGTSDSLNGGAYADAGTVRDDGWGMQRGGAGEYKQPTGRWPANLIHDGSDEVLAGFPQSNGAHGVGDNPRSYSYDKSAARTMPPQTRKPFDYGGDTGSAARFFYCAKASKADRDEGNHHPTVKPTALMRYLCKLVTPPAGTVLDPFMGSGSTGKAARMEGFGFIGIEQDAEYIAIARARIAHAVQSPAQQPLHI